MDGDLFFDKAGLDRGNVQAIVDDALAGSDDGDLFLEFCRSESFSFDDGRLKAATFDTTQGFGLRAVAGEATGYAHANELSEDAIRRAAQTVKAVAKGHSGSLALSPSRTNAKLYGDADPLASAAFAAKIGLLEEMNAYARSKDSRVCQVSCVLAGEHQTIEILRAGGETWRDIRPLVRIGVSVVVEENGRQESGSHGGGGRSGYETYLKPQYWKDAVDEALRQALVNLESVPAPAGGWTAGLGGLLGERVGAPGVTVVDDGTIGGRRGSLTIDDEGTPTTRTVLIEDGLLVGYMQDRQNARLMDMRPTGNGRRESYAHVPMPRMTNTYMLAGTLDPAEIIASVKDG